MKKMIANGTVLGWSTFWIFGFLAISAPAGATGQMVGATLLAFVGLGIGVFCYLRLVRGDI